MAPGPIIVVGLGPGDPDALTLGARAALDAGGRRFVRTRRHPSAGLVGDDATSFDDLYEAADALDEVYTAIVERLVMASEEGPVCYAVPGSPLVAERTVELLRARADLDVSVVPAMSFLDLAWDRLGVDPFACGARLVDGHRFALDAAGSAGPFLVAQCDSRSVLSDIKLAVDPPPGEPAVILSRLGLPDEAVTRVTWADLDRSVEPDHLTSVWIPTLATPVAGEVAALSALVRTLRASCPWDRRQTHQSLTRHLLEETYEVLAAIDELPVPAAAADDGTVADDLGSEAWEHFEEELGDLLFQVVFHATLAAEEGRFELADVARGIHDKLVERHPHVFAPSGPTMSADDVAASWEQRKLAEKQRDSVMDDLPPALPALAFAAKAQGRAAALGLDWPSAEPLWAVVAGELDELAAAVGGPDPAAAAAELGDVLFSVVNLARHLGIDAEGALRSATGRFGRRVRHVEASAATVGVAPGSADPVALDQWWEQAKAAAG